jgi:hypothetical protein
VIGGDEAVTVEVLRANHEEYFKLVHPFLNALQQKKKSILDWRILNGRASSNSSRTLQANESKPRLASLK